jgi:predicted aspartyl protease
MGSTHVNAIIYGPLGSREYAFLIDTGSTFVGLPSTEIEELGLVPVRNGTVELLTAEGIAERQMYVAQGEVEGRGFVAAVIAAPTPLIGYEVLESLRFRVNPITQSLERVPLDEPHPPFLL